MRQARKNAPRIIDFRSNTHATVMKNAGRKITELYEEQALNGLNPDHIQTLSDLMLHASELPRSKTHLKQFLELYRLNQNTERHTDPETYRQNKNNLVLAIAACFTAHHKLPQLDPDDNHFYKRVVWKDGKIDHEHAMWKMSNYFSDQHDLPISTRLKYYPIILREEKLGRGKNNRNTDTKVAFAILVAQELEEDPNIGMACPEIPEIHKNFLNDLNLEDIWNYTHDHQRPYVPIIMKQIALMPQIDEETRKKARKTLIDFAEGYGMTAHGNLLLTCATIYADHFIPMFSKDKSDSENVGRLFRRLMNHSELDQPQKNFGPALIKLLPGMKDDDLGKPLLPSHILGETELKNIKFVNDHLHKKKSKFNPAPQWYAQYIQRGHDYYRQHDYNHKKVFPHFINYARMFPNHDNNQKNVTDLVRMLMEEPQYRQYDAYTATLAEYLPSLKPSKLQQTAIKSAYDHLPEDANKRQEALIILSEKTEIIMPDVSEYVKQQAIKERKITTQKTKQDELLALFSRAVHNGSFEALYTVFSNSQTAMTQLHEDREAAEQEFSKTPKPRILDTAQP